MSRNQPSDLHLRAQRDDIHGGPPAKWPRRESDLPAVVRHGRGKGSGVGPHLTNLFPPKSKRGTNTLQNHRAARTMAKGPGWYRSKSGSWHDIDADGAAECGAEVLRDAGPRDFDVLPTRKVCIDCLTCDLCGGEAWAVRETDLAARCKSCPLPEVAA